MDTLRRPLQRLTWLVMVAVCAWGVLSLSCAWRTTGWMLAGLDVCSATGRQGTQTPGSPSDHGAHKQCPVCGHGLGGALPLAASAALHLPDAVQEQPLLFAQAHHPLFAWAAPLSRGPPSLTV